MPESSTDSAFVGAGDNQATNDPTELELIEAERTSVESKLNEALRPGADNAVVPQLQKILSRLDRLAELENPQIKRKAMEILEKGDPVGYIIGTYNRLHVGDTQIGKVLLLSIANQCIINSGGLQPKLSGPSGKGKTHAAKAMFHLIPDVGYKLEGSLSAKALFYHPDLKPGTIIFSDDVTIGQDLEDTLKRAMTNFQEPTNHMTVRDGVYQELVIPPRIVWWLTSVSNPFSDELSNRLFGLNVDDSVEQDGAVTNQQFENAVHGDVELPEDEDIKICRAIIHVIKKRLFKVDIPYARGIVWMDSSGDRRNLPRFLDIIRGFAVLRFMQRFELNDDEICASIKDFEDSKALFEEGQASLTTKLTEAELRLVQWMAGRGRLSINDVVREYRKANGEPYTHEAIRKTIMGARAGQGLTNKVPGMRVYEEDGARKFEIPSFDERAKGEMVSLTPDAYSMYAEAMQ